MADDKGRLLAWARREATRRACSDFAMHLARARVTGRKGELAVPPPATLQERLDREAVERVLAELRQRWAR